MAGMILPEGATLPTTPFNSTHTRAAKPFCERLEEPCTCGHSMEYHGMSCGWPHQGACGGLRCPCQSFMLWTEDQNGGDI